MLVRPGLWAVYHFNHYLCSDDDLDPRIEGSKGSKDSKGKEKE
jgi:hypothetical protein